MLQPLIHGIIQTFVWLTEPKRNTGSILTDYIHSSVGRSPVYNHIFNISIRLAQDTQGGSFQPLRRIISDCYNREFDRLIHELMK